MIPQYRINNNYGNYDEYKVKIPKVVCMIIYYEKKEVKLCCEEDWMDCLCAVHTLSSGGRGLW